MGNIQACGCDDPNIIKQNSIEGISKNLQLYAMENNLGFFPRDTRQVLQKLFVLNQSHVSDKIIKLDFQKKHQIRDKMIQDLKRVDLQQFDEFCHITKNIQNNKYIYQSKQKKISNQQISFAKIGSKSVEEGQKYLNNAKIMLIFTYKCFDKLRGLNSTVPTDLPSRKSLIQIFMDKVIGLEHRYGCHCQIYLICPKKRIQQISKFITADLKILSYEPDQPCFSSQNKIVLYGDTVQFNQDQGDLIHFIMTHPTLKNIQDSFDYINFCDLTNFASPAINVAHLGYLHSHKNLLILASLKTNELSLQNIKTMDNFIQITNVQFGDILMKTQMIRQMRNRNSNLYQILATRIERRKQKNTPDTYYFSRLAQDILYKQFSQIAKVPYVAANKVQYSNFCKQLIGIENENQRDLVEVCPSIIHGDQHILQNIIDTLKKNANTTSYPIIIMQKNAYEE